MSPGDAPPGILIIDGDYTQGSGGAYDEFLAGLTAGTGYSQLDVVKVSGADGVASLDGALDITKSAGFSLAVGDVFTIMEFANSTRNFSTFDYNGAACSFASGVLGCANGVQFTELYASGDTMLDLLVDKTGMTAIPEPSTSAMMAIGFAALGLAGFRKAQRAAQAG